MGAQDAGQSGLTHPAEGQLDTPGTKQRILRMATAKIRSSALPEPPSSHLTLRPPDLVLFMRKICCVECEQLWGRAAFPQAHVPWLFGCP